MVHWLPGQDQSAADSLRGRSVLRIRSPKSVLKFCYALSVSAYKAPVLSCLICPLPFNLVQMACITASFVFFLPVDTKINVYSLENHKPSSNVHRIHRECEREWENSALTAASVDWSNAAPPPLLPLLVLLQPPRHQGKAVPPTCWGFCHVSQSVGAWLHAGCSICVIAATPDWV